MGDIAIAKCQLLHTSHTHDFGVNALDVRLISVSNVESEVIWKVQICSGGDDQSLSVCKYDIKVVADKTCSVSCSSYCAERKCGAAGAAFRGVQFIERACGAPDASILTVACDQRISLWDLQSCQSGVMDDCDDIERDTHSSIKWNSGAITNIGDINALSINVDVIDGTLDGVAVVVGEGFQLFTIDD